MGTGYTRNDTANNIADGNVINASDLDGEFDAIQSAFNGTTGHSHDGTTGEGPQIGAAGIANDAVALGTKTTGNYVAAGAVSGVGLSGSASAEGATFTVTSNATSANTASTIVARDASGNFSAGTITANLTGTASNATNAADAALLDSLDSTQFLRSDAADTKTSGDLTFSDDVKATFGSAADGLQIYNTAAGDKFISEAGSGNLKIQGDNLYLQNSAGTENHIIAISDGAVTLHYDSSAKLATKTDGVDITGELQADSLDIDGAADISGVLSLHNHLSLDDSDEIRLGTSNDLLIYHDGNSKITDVGDGKLELHSNGTGVTIQKGATEYMAQFLTDGAVQLYYDNAQKLATNSGGVTVTGTVTADGVSLGDSEYIYLGAGNDLQIYHNGTDSFIDDQGTGKLVLKGNTAVEIRGTNGEDLAVFNMDGAVNLYYDNIKKFETTSVGVTVSGDIIGPASADFDIKTGSGTGEMLFHTNSLERVRIGLDGKVGIGQSATTDLLEVNGDVRAVDFNATSDERLKSNIRQIENALDKVCQMNGMHYVLDGKESSGVIAQNIQTVAPEAVSDSGEHLTVAYNQLIGYLVEAVKELKTEVEELKNGNTPSVS